MVEYRGSSRGEGLRQWFDEDLIAGVLAVRLQMEYFSGGTLGRGPGSPAE